MEKYLNMKVINNNNPLFALVCGFEHSGTTLVSEILRQHPQLDSGFEGGFLLNNEAKEFLTTEPFYTNSKKGWGLKDEDLSYICNGDNWAEVYLRIRERAEVIKNKNVSLFDKTPRYMQKLPNVLERVPDIPCLVIVKDIRSVFWSSYKRAKMTMDEWHKKIFKRTCNHTLSYAKGWKEAIEKGLEKRILLIKYEELCLDQKNEVKKIFDFLGLEFQESYLTFNNPKYNNVYGREISGQYLTEYKGNLPEYICEEILELTSEYSDWLWSHQQTDKSGELLPSQASVQLKSKISSSEENTQNQQSMASSANILNPSSDPTYNPDGGDMKKSDEYRDFFEFVNQAVDFSYSQKLQDLWGLWENRNIEKGYFVEFGALSGINVSNSYLMELLGWDGILAEPHPNYRQILKKNRNCNICYDAVYSLTGKELVFKAVVGSPALSTLELSLPDDQQKKKRENAQDYIVTTISLNDLLEQFNAPLIIDFISIDTEGSELEILSTFNFTKYQFRSICIEYGTEAKRKKIFEILTKQGYVRKWENLSEQDDWYVNRKICNPTDGELELISKIRNLKADFTFAASRDKKKKKIEKLLERTPINFEQVHREKYRRCAIFQFEAVHEETIPTLVYALNQNGYMPYVYVNARCEIQRGDIFSQIATLDFELYYWRLDSRQDWERLTEKARHQDIEFICISTFQSDGIAKWADQVGKPIIGVIHNVNLFLASEHCRTVFASGKLQVLTLAHHVAVFLHQRIDKELTDRVGVIEPVLWGGNFGENRASLNQEKIVAIPGGVNFKTREYSTLLAVLEDQGLRKDINGLVFKVLGGGSDRTILEQEVVERGLSSRILFAPLGPSGMVFYKDYFTALQGATFLYPLAPLSFYHYREHKITSAIPTALGFNLPIVLDRWTARTYRIPALISDATVAASVAYLIEVGEREIRAKRQTMADYYRVSLMEGIEELKRLIYAIA